MSHAELTGQAMAVVGLRRSAVWDTVQFVISGVIFVLLGEQLPGILSKAVRHGSDRATTRIPAV